MSYDENFRPKSVARKTAVAATPQPPQPPQQQPEIENPLKVQPSTPAQTQDSKKEPATPKAPPTPAAPTGARSGDNMIDRPKSRPKPLPKTASFTAESALTPNDNEDFGLEIEDLLCRSKIGIKGLFRSSFWALALSLILALLLLYISSQAISILHDALTMPTPGREAALGLLALLLCIIVYVIIRALVFAVRLSGGSQLNIEQLVSITNFNGLRSYRLATEEFLKPYLRKLVKLKPKQRKKFLQTGGKNAEKIIAAANRLLETERRLGSREWVMEFIDNIQLPMEALARERINDYARAAALKTAISPWPLVDMAAVIYNSTMMLTDLAVIFNRRLTAGNAVYVLMGMFFNIFIAGKTQEAVAAIENEIEHHAGAHGAGIPDPADATAHIGSLTDTAFADLGHNALLFAKFSSKKIAEGAASWLLMKRLGRRTVKMLKPIA